MKVVQHQHNGFSTSALGVACPEPIPSRHSLNFLSAWPMAGACARLRWADHLGSPPCGGSDEGIDRDSRHSNSLMAG